MCHPELVEGPRAGNASATRASYLSQMEREPSNTELMTAIVELHNATGQGFARVDARFEQVEARLARVETQITSIGGELKGINGWMSRNDQRLAALELR